MSWTSKWTMLAAALALTGLAAAGAQAQGLHFRGRAAAANLVVPQSRAYSIDRAKAVEITGVKVGIVIVEQVATTTMDIDLKNLTGRQQEAELIVPVPEGAVVRGFDFHGSAGEPVAVILPRDEATATYNAIVAKIRDPALLEFVGTNLVRSAVFPVPPGGTQRVRLTYEHLLNRDGERVDYELPRSASLDVRVPWDISARIQSKTPVSTAYSPSHAIEVVRKDETTLSVRLKEEARTEPGSYLLSWLIAEGDVAASLIAYPEPGVGGGYFLLLAGLPAKLPGGPDGPAIKREVTLVLDRSGSMNGEKIEQVREATLQVLAGLADGEAFNLIVYNQTVDLLSPQPVVKSDATVKAARAFLENVRAQGGTNIHDALVEALRQKPTDEMLPIVLFLTDGLPTIGQTSEVAIREVAAKHNPFKRRIFTFGVGVDVNTPLLQNIATDTRATATFALPREDVEVKVAQVFRKLYGPVIADPELKVVSSPLPPGEGRVRAVAEAPPIALARVRDLFPSKLPDFFEGDQLVLLGQYIGEDPISFELSGNYLGRRRTFRFTFGVKGATTKNAFVPRLWASRKIGVLVEAIRKMGADRHTERDLADLRSDPRLKELIDEVIRLSTEFGVLTEYTAFLAREGTDLTRHEEVLRVANDNFVDRAARVRSGVGSYNQESNLAQQSWQTSLNGRNRWMNDKLDRVESVNVQQINDRAFYRRGDRWIDSRLIDQKEGTEPDTVIEFGSDAWRQLVMKLVEQNRNGAVSLRGDILMEVEGKSVLVKSAK